MFLIARYWYNVYVVCDQEERVLFHYNGHGVPKPTENGEIWVFNKVRYNVPFSTYIALYWL